jgi:hypothetical protein
MPAPAEFPGRARSADRRHQAPAKALETEDACAHIDWTLERQGTSARRVVRGLRRQHKTKEGRVKTENQGKNGNSPAREKREDSTNQGSRDESQRIAAWKLLYRVRHPDPYVSRLQTIPHSDVGSSRDLDSKETSSLLCTGP